MHTDSFEILPVGTSPVSAPYFSFHENGKELHYSYVNSWEEGMKEAFTQYAWPGGYPVLYIQDGDILCAECARKHYMDTGERLPAITEGDNYGFGTYCGECSAEIIPECCADCSANTFSNEPGISNFHTPVFVSEGGEAQVCARCIAKHVVNGTATKTGQLAYTVTDAWYGTGVYTAR